MKKQYLLFAVLIATSVTFAWQKTDKIDTKRIKSSHSFVNGSPSGRTGAPGELTCATSGCHGGTAMDGTAENVFVVTYNGAVVTSYIPGETYNIALALASNPARKGFQATVLDASNNFVGTLTPITAGGTSSTTGMGRTYINQTSAGSTAVTWLFNWTAPATDAGVLRFYVATNKSNDNGNNSGDEIFTSVHTLGSTASLEETISETVSDFSASFSSENSSVHLSYSSLVNGTSNVNIVDMNGRSVLNSEMNASTIGENKDMIRIPGAVKNGMYVVHFFVNNTAVSKTISIQR